MPLERWRTVRRPSPLDAARLTLGFGRVVERIASAGFPAGRRLAMVDLAVGPGPTPFVERPLLGDPARARASRPARGSRVAGGDPDRRPLRRPDGRAGRRGASDARCRRLRLARRVPGRARARRAALGRCRRRRGWTPSWTGLFDEDDRVCAELLPGRRASGRGPPRSRPRPACCSRWSPAASVLGLGRGGGSPAHATPATGRPATAGHTARPAVPRSTPRRARPPPP